MRALKPKLPCRIGFGQGYPFLPGVGFHLAERAPLGGSWAFVSIRFGLGVNVANSSAMPFFSSSSRSMRSMNRRSMVRGYGFGGFVSV
jgi:hypothetical protein